MAKESKTASKSQDISTKGAPFTDEFLKQNQKKIWRIGGVIGILVLLWFAYLYYERTVNQEAQAEMYSAVYYFEQDSLQKALYGDGVNYGFLDIADKYSRSEAGNLARFYAGASFLKRSAYDSALRYLEDYASDDLLIQARTYALIGDAYMELENYEEASKNYWQAARHKPNEYYSPVYLEKAGVAFENSGDIGAAYRSYKLLCDEYASHAQHLEHEKQAARLKAQLKP